MSGLFVVFEGGDSAGKTTQSELLCGWLKARGRAFVATRQPGGTEVGSHLRRLVLDPSFGDVSPRAEALMYAADKAQHVHELIAPALARGEVVVSDRYVESMVAYQGDVRFEPASGMYASPSVSGSPKTRHDPAGTICAL